MMNEDLNGIKKDSQIKFPGQETGEKVNLFFRRHPFSFLGFGFLGSAMIIFPIIILLTLLDSGILQFDDPLEPKIAVAIISGYILFVLGMMIVAWMNYYLDVYIVTDRRLIDIHQEGLFSRSLSAVDLVDVEDVNAEVKGLLPTYFDYGNVDIQTAGEIQNVNFYQVPKPYLLARRVMDYHEQAVREEKEEILEQAGERAADRSSQLDKIEAIEDKEEKQISKSTSSPDSIEGNNEIDNKIAKKKEPEDSDLEIKREPKTEFKPELAEDNIEEGTVEKEDLEEGGEVNF
jgi:hypothetical protein